MSLRTARPAEAVGRMDEILDLYRSARARSPQYVTEAVTEALRGPFLAQLRHGGAEVVLDDESGVLVGAAWGWGAGAPDDRVHRLARSVVGPELAGEALDPPAFAVGELMVGRSVQGEGRGRRLLEALVCRRRAWLLVPAAYPALGFLEHRGWSAVATLTDPAGVPQRVMVRPPRPRSVRKY